MVGPITPESGQYRPDSAFVVCAIFGLLTGETGRIAGGAVLHRTQEVGGSSACGDAAVTDVAVQPGGCSNSTQTRHHRRPDAFLPH
jgi:hypothetical protein